MADEKRRLIYELLVEAKGADKSKTELEGFGKQLSKLGGLAKGVTGIFAAGFALKGIGDALDELTKFNQGMAALGVTGQAAAQALHGVQDIAFKTGNSMQGVTDVYKEAVQLQGQLGRSTEDAARTTDAFIRIANAEGKTAAQAAQSIQTLSFALESGVLPAKQFTQMLRDSPTFAKAAQDALGKTTEQLVAMAKEGDISAESLTKVIIALEHIGENTETALTVGGIVDSLKTLITTIIQATAEGANFNAAVTGNQSGWTSFMEQTRGFFQALGGAIAVASNILQGLFDVAVALVKLFDPTKSLTQKWNEFGAAVEEDFIDMGRGFHNIWEGMHSDFSEMRSEAAMAAKEAEQYEKDLETRRRARVKTYTDAFGKSFDTAVEKWKKAQEDAPAQWRKFYEEEAKERKKREKEELDDWWAMQDEKARIAAEAAKRRADDEKEIQKGLKEFAEKNEKDLDKTISEMREVHIEGLSRQYFQEIDAMAEGAYILADAFADLFTGGIRSAREFFQVILRGLAQVFAQIAAQRLAQSIMDAVGGALGTGGVKSLSGGSWAKGGAFDRGQVIPFAGGGVVHGPTVFPMAHGSVGLMGEAGPEAVMPLKRMSNGKLGVASGMPNIQIVNKLGVMAKGRAEKNGDRMSIVLEAAQLGASMAEQKFNRSVRSGYGTAAQSVQSTYGLRRKV